MSQRAKASNTELLIGLKRQLQKVLFNQQQLLQTLEKNNLVPEYNAAKPKVIDTKNVDESKCILQGEYKKLENFEVVLAVVGTMKAGKSTTINAIVGREVLPNRNRPMTSLPTLIAHKKGQIEPILTFDTKQINQYFAQLNKTDLDKYAQHEKIDSYKEIVNFIAKIKKGYQFESKYQGEQAIFDFLAELNDLVRLSRVISKDHETLNFPFSAYKEINALPRIEVEFTELAQQDEQMGNLVLLDTPGPNEADLPELKEIFNQQLKRSSAVMVVMDYTQLKSKADKEIRDELEKLPKIETERLFALVNKFDQKNAHGDDENTTKNIIVNDLLRNQIKIENVYCISAQDAFLANRLISYIQQNQDKPNVDEGWVKDFANKAFGTRAKRMYDSANCQDLIEDSKAMVENSRISLPLNNVIIESYKNAPQIAMKSALNDVDSIFTNIKNVFDIKERFMAEVSLNDSEIKKIQGTIEQLGRDIEVLKKTTEQSKTELDTISKQSNEEFNKEFDALEEQSADYIWSQIVYQIHSFQTGKQKELRDQKKWLTLDSDYRKEREQLKAELKDLENSFEKDKGKISLRQSEMEKLSQIMESQQQEINAPLIEAIRSKLNQMAQSINKKIAEKNAAIVSRMQEIRETFGKEGINISLSKLNIADIHLSDNIGVNILNLSSKKDKEHWRTTNKVTRWFGSLFNQDSWGRESYTVTYCDVSLDALKAEVKKLSMQGILEPVQKQITQSLENFTIHMARDVEAIELLAEKLKNELEAALADEHIPSLELKQQRKAALRLISLQNHNIQKEVEVVKNMLNIVLGGVNYE